VSLTLVWEKESKENRVKRIEVRIWKRGVGRVLSLPKLRKFEVVGFKFCIVALIIECFLAQTVAEILVL
jgi:hypothetical protein